MTALLRDGSEGLPELADLADVSQVTFHDRRCHLEMVRMTRNLATANERRGRQRFSINAPLTVILGDHEVPAYTRDLTNVGVYFYLSLADGAVIDRDFEFLVELPPEITLSSCCRIRGRGRLVRKENASIDWTGVAAEILDYSIIREARSVAS